MFSIQTWRRKQNVDFRHFSVVTVIIEFDRFFHML